jgi:N-glycosylase/DNA lyase
LSRWKKSAENEWSCALHGRILSLRQDSDFLHYRAIYPTSSDAPLTPPSSHMSVSGDGDDTLSLIKHYFNLETNLTELYGQWAAADTNFKKKAPKFTGVRILKQDPWEALVGFICSSNNNIQRICQMVDKLCANYGPLIGHVNSQAYHDFPPPSALINPKVEQELRQLGFGYRAKYLYKTAIMIHHDKGLGWLEGLRNPESLRSVKERRPAGELIEGGREGYRKAHEELLELQGVGPKVADCICLFGLGWGESIPVDTHGMKLFFHRSYYANGTTVWQIAQRDYKFGKGKHSSLTKATYDAVGNRFRSLWGKEAGWAHSVLFTADLRAFSERLVAKTELKVEEQSTQIISDGEFKAELVDINVAVADKRIKRELPEDEHQLLQVEQTTVKRVKRRKAR